MRIVDQFGNVVVTDNSNVTLAIDAQSNPGNDTLHGTVTVAAVNGVATFDNVNVQKVGTGYKLTATDGILTQASSAAFNITNFVSHHLNYAQQPVSTIVSQTIPPVVVNVVDQFDNLVIDDNSFVSMIFSANPPPPNGATLSGTTTVQAINGVATFSNLSINQVGYKLQSVDGSLVPGVSNVFQIANPNPDHLAFQVQPSNTVASQAINPAIVVPQSSTSSATWWSATAPWSLCRSEPIRAAASSAAP